MHHSASKPPISQRLKDVIHCDTFWSDSPFSGSDRSQLWQQIKELFAAVEQLGDRNQVHNSSVVNMPDYQANFIIRQIKSIFLNEAFIYLWEKLSKTT